MTGAGGQSLRCVAASFGYLGQDEATRICAGLRAGACKPM